jgi:hypothetical protein
MSEFDKLEGDAQKFAQEHPEQVKKGEKAVEDKLGLGQPDSDQAGQSQVSRDQGGENQATDDQGDGQQDEDSQQSTDSGGENADPGQ